MSGLLQEESTIGKKMTLLGAGGAATAICIQAALDGVSSIAIFDRYPEKYKEKIATIKKETNCTIQIYDLADSAKLHLEVKNSAIFGQCYKRRHEKVIRK